MNRGGGVSYSAADTASPGNTSSEGLLLGDEGDSAGDVLIAPAEEFEYVRSPSVLRLAMVGFFLVSGGPIGVEGLVKEGGPAYAFLALLVFPVLWAVPQILLTAEMASLHDKNGGYIIWVTDALGDYAGWMNAFVSVWTNIVDEAVYPTLVVDYLLEATELSTAGQWTIRIGVVLLVVALNLGNVAVVGRASYVFLLLVLSPFIVMFFVVLGRGDIAPSEFVKPRSDGKGVNWGAFLQIAFWNLSGWDSLGSLAGEVGNAKRTFPLAMAIAVLLCVASYALPLMAAVSTSHDDYSEYDDGFFVTAGERIAPFLKMWILVAAIFSAIGIFNAVMAAHVRALWRMAHLQYAPRILTKTTVNGAPIAAIALHATLAILLSDLSFEELVEIDNVLFGISLILEKLAFIYLKHSHPDIHRPFAVPGGLKGAIGVSLPAFVIIFAIILYASLQTWLVCGGIVVLFSALYVAWRRGWLVVFSRSWKPLPMFRAPASIDVSYTDEAADD